jgi:hypothetical protein
VNRVWALLLLCSCDYAFRIDHIDPPAGDGGRDATGDATCGPEREGVIAYYPIDGDSETLQITDRGPHGLHGSVSSGFVTTTTGPSTCHEGLLIAEGREVSIPHDDRFQLASGSIDLWVRPIPLSAVSPLRVVIARDLGNNNPGDLTLFEHRLATADLVFVVRLQSGDAMNSGGGTYRCSAVTLVAGSWYHVAVNFGPPDLELFVDGALQTSTHVTTINGEQIVCGTSTSGQSATQGIDGTPAKPWFVGYGDVFETSIVRRYLSSGGIDHVRIGSERF